MFLPETDSPLPGTPSIVLLHAEHRHRYTGGKRATPWALAGELPWVGDILDIPEPKSVTDDGRECAELFPLNEENG